MALPRTLLLVEDNEDDIFFFQRAFNKGAFPHLLQIARDGREARDYLAGTGAFSDRARHPLPFAVFLDLKLPLMHGFDVLRWIRSQPSLDDLTVLVLTSSAELHDVAQAREFAASAFLVKPPSPPMLNEVIAALEARPRAPAPIACAGNLLLEDVPQPPA